MSIKNEKRLFQIWILVSLILIIVSFCGCVNKETSTEVIAENENYTLTQINDEGSINTKDHSEEFCVN